MFYIIFLIVMNRFSAFVLVCLTLFSVSLFAQKKKAEPGAQQPPATPAKQRFAAYDQRQKLQQSSLVANVPFRNIGPTVMSGRVVDVDASPQDPTRFYVAYASGGLWRSTTNGITFEPLFDNQAVMTIGDVAVDWSRPAGTETIWLGTGENNSSRSSYAGAGIYKSVDAGKTWLHTGLEETHHIGRIVLHPTDPNTVFAAALGHLYSPNTERGVFKTSDGGKTWRKTLFVDDNTGAIDLVIDPKNPQNLYAAMWYRTRRAWNFEEGGKTSGIYKSTDGGETWKLATTKESGFPAGEGVGRIGLAIYPANPNIVYAILDNQFTKAKEKPDEFKLDKDTLRTITKDVFLKLEKPLVADFLRENGFPKEYTADSVKKLVETGKITPLTLVEYLEDANAALFDTPIVGLEIYRSDDGGKSWKRTHDKPLENVFYTYGYYFAQIRVTAFDDKLIYFVGVPALKSDDGGKTFASIGAENVHVDHHALWLHPTRRGAFILGNDGGVHITYDDGKTYFKANTPPVAQFYHVVLDMDKPYNVYGGLQDNGVWTGASTNKPDREWYADGQYPFKSIMGGDGMQTQVDTRDNATAYTGFQFGNYFRLNKNGGTPPARITPQHKLGERPYRFNWQAPILLSKHNQDILYFGSHKLHRSFDKGASYEAISGDLTRGGKIGNVPYGTLATIDESPFRFGLLYTGSDDGVISCSRDGGVTWDRISDNLPKELKDFYVSRVQASKHDTSVVYASLNGYRFDNFEPFVFRSANYGKTWERIGTNLPTETVNVIKEDPVNASILYVGTDNGLYVSLDKGKTFAAFMGNGAKESGQEGVLKGALPHVAVHDVVIHPRDKEIVVGTHGRSLYVADVSHIQQLTPEFQAKPLAAFSIKAITHGTRWGQRGFGWSAVIEPSVSVGYYARQAGSAVVRVKGEGGVVLAELTDAAEAGLNYVGYNCAAKDSITLVAHLEKVNAKNAASGAASGTTDKKDSVKKDDKVKVKLLKAKAGENGVFYLPAGKYTVEIELNGAKETQPLEIKEQKRGGGDSASPRSVPGEERYGSDGSADEDDEGSHAWKAVEKLGK